MLKKTSPPIVYEIRVEGSLGSLWTDWFEGLRISQVQDDQRGQPVTVLCGPLADQPALHGLLAKVRDLNLTLVSVTRLELEQPIGEVEEKERSSKKAEELR